MRKIGQSESFKPCTPRMQHVVLGALKDTHGLISKKSFSRHANRRLQAERAINYFRDKSNDVTECQVLFAVKNIGGANNAIIQLVLNTSRGSYICPESINLPTHEEKWEALFRVVIYNFDHYVSWVSFCQSKKTRISQLVAIERRIGFF